MKLTNPIKNSNPIVLLCIFMEIILAADMLTAIAMGKVSLPSYIILCIITMVFVGINGITESKR